MCADEGARVVGPGSVVLSRTAIVEEALAAIDEHGPHGLTIRMLGERLGVQTMSLYEHITGREDLLEGVVVQLLDGLTDGMDDLLTKSWQGYLQELAHRVRAIAVLHPSAFPLVATRHPATPWLRPPLRSVEIVQHLLASLSRHGIADAKVVQIYRAFSSFLLGQLLLESASHGAQTGSVEEPLDEGNADISNRDGDVDLSEAPLVARLQPMLSEDHGAEEFEVGLETLLDRLELELSQ